MVKKLRKYQRFTVVYVLIFSIITFFSGAHIWGLLPPARAAALTSVKDVLSTSESGANANHTIQFVTPSGVLLSTHTVTLTFDGSPLFDVSGLDEDDVDMSEDTTGDIGDCGSFATAKTTIAGAPDGTNWGVTFSGQTIVFTHPSGDDNQDIAAGACVQIRIGDGTVAMDSGTGDAQINNPAGNGDGVAEIETIDIATDSTVDDSGTAMTATVEGVAVSVTVDESLAFSIAVVTSGNCTEGGGGTAVTTTATTVPFDSIALAVNTFYRGCHDLTVSTNAANGYTTTVEENKSLIRTGTDGGDKTINDAICDAGDDCTSAIGAGTTSPWATATANHGFGYTCSGSACDAAFATAAEFNAFPCRSSTASDCDPVDGPLALATPISSGGVPVSAQTSRIVYKLSFSATQPAGTYGNTITYITTPTF
ncbi:hypothetical protein A3E96_01785 [Candidatus Uhrbacteria bacterium RIFCSPHIGHO2_12_FULL_46_13]|uniref:Uncharacterized protein n=1 Tax=Candidatus Uhrbacteria bacterium RIFCSPLOWO2_01_FULL_47_25 TaxID=1802402 RepID=A0A1F7UXH0_9BACT|nr:MAG: hypothetical protein UX68_C0032G0002 [Parcubacteria group bacterium GW2011_GWA2_46_9]OGL60674.1 MAG: hypothetical protein A2752_04240 [Candidatus Uhrbacteria bacterium RIFCSPHIGHO2_01_FULL_46_23]OGL70305.1 MAG: hypothetical protein A3D60_01755 [Candidatus Uhrbacteria bacterium RIFCSPHIGHO2_02_FULL_47_29]OGL75091.1 MAG: hypothetical protein A3E96_01785 [Candidatus Uhrbacteria bacterium RIFCSPHIGHO2_12_FULL_46_13]OGL82992.1 MAG: hypothetical protein A2936_03500 [Candidatus Uhrbacteria bac